MMALVSIIMPVFNAEPYLRACIDSILCQTHTEWELLAVDDFSTDSSYSILQQYQHQDQRIQVLKSTEKGIIPALRTGYVASSGGFVTRMDADDIMHKEKIEKLLVAVDRQALSVAVGGVAYFSEDGEVMGGYARYAQWLNDLLASGKVYADIYKECVIPSPCWMMSSQTLDHIGAFDADRYPEDYDLAFRLYKHHVPVRAVQEPIHSWRDHRGRTSRTDPHYADQAFLPLKMHYFAMLEWRLGLTVALWGAGRAGKVVARELAALGIPFSWYTDNSKKIDKDIYGIVLQSAQRLVDSSPDIVITAIRSPDFREENSSTLQALSQLDRTVLHFY